LETLLDIGPDIDPRAALGDKGYDSKSPKAMMPIRLPSRRVVSLF
jgi:hypothetical protein